MVNLLATHSAYSLLEGLALPAELVQAAEAAGLPCLGLADHRLLSGAVEFTSACRRAGIKPILGLEIDLAAAEPNQLPTPLTLLATGLEGWAVAYTAFLDGNLYQDSHSVDKEPLVAEWKTGAVWVMGRAEIGFVRPSPALATGGQEMPNAVCSPLQKRVTQPLVPYRPVAI